MRLDSAGGNRSPPGSRGRGAARLLLRASPHHPRPLWAQTSLAGGWCRRDTGSASPRCSLSDQTPVEPHQTLRVAAGSTGVMLVRRPRPRPLRQSTSAARETRGESQVNSSHFLCSGANWHCTFWPKGLLCGRELIMRRCPSPFWPGHCRQHPSARCGGARRPCPRGRARESYEPPQNLPFSKSELLRAQVQCTAVTGCAGKMHF